MKLGLQFAGGAVVGVACAYVFSVGFDFEPQTGLACAALVLYICLLFEGLVGRALRRLRRAAARSKRAEDLIALLAPEVADRRSSSEVRDAARMILEALKSTIAEREETRLGLETALGESRSSEKRLREALERSEQLSLRKTHFLAHVSHELRTSLGAILGYTEVLGDGSSVTDERKHSVVALRRNGEHLLELVNDILDLSKVEAGKLEVELVECSLVKILKDIVSVISVRATTKGIRLEEAFRNPIPARIVTDPTRLRQVLMNLMGNAVKFTDQGLVSITTSYTELSEPESVLEFQIKDTGIGIPPEKVELLFQPFRQLEMDTARKYGGTGLGLAISKQIAKLLGGDISFTSSPGLGSLFTFRLRCKVPEGTPMLKRPPSAVLDESNRSTQNPSQKDKAPPIQGNILVVDDSADNRKLFKYHLERAGARVDCAENGAEAVTKASDTRFDLILMDIQMPTLDGFGALRQIRERGNWTPVVALTAHAMKGDRERCLDAGFTDYLSKPVTRTTLLEKVASMIPVRPSDSDAGTPASTAQIGSPPAAAEAAPADDGGYERILADFRATLPQRRASLELARQSGRADELRRLIHTLQGTAGSMGLDRLAEVLARAQNALTHAAARDCLGVIQEVIDALENESKRVPVLQRSS
jgi:signal transduction histidine kinase/CheY-like chemotaxis protein